MRLLRALGRRGPPADRLRRSGPVIYAFSAAADVGGILTSRTHFPRRDGTPARCAWLTTFAPLRARRWLPPPGLQHRPGLGRSPRLPAAPSAPAPHLTADRPSPVEAYTYPTAGAETDNVADILRPPTWRTASPWATMAVLVPRRLPLPAGAAPRADPRRRTGLEVDGDDAPLRHNSAGGRRC
ncbi:hypothetical protein GCM10020221_35170 [Streptomyces thioluteus]|uniref:Uncharacterized protein n=1 Tax=Streptomyces thioluteus TaxID=66431 RepID=A0ABN3X4S0_STRTU